MKKFAKYMLVLSIAGSLSTSALFAQEEYDYSYSAPEAGMSFLGVPVWGWVTAGLAIGGMAAVAATHNSRTAHNDS